MLVSYQFSLMGRDHKKNNLPCQDYSVVKSISNSWKIAVVADGVGSCKYADVASKLAAETVVELIEKQFPVNADDSVYMSVLISAMHGASNAIETYVAENDPENIEEYCTTLAVAIFNVTKIFYGNAGDSGIIALDENGLYHVLTRKQNDQSGAVYAIPFHRNFEIGKADFIPVAVMCMTDGIFDYVAPNIYKDQKYKVKVPLANIFCTFALALEGSDVDDIVCNYVKELEDFLQSDRCKPMTDDLSVAAIVSSDSFLNAEDISWEEPEIDYYRIKWNELSIYNHNPHAKVKLMSEYVKERNPEWTDDQIDEFIKSYMKDSDNDENDSAYPSTNGLNESNDNICDLGESSSDTLLPMK